MTSAVIFSYTDLMCFAGGINKSEVNFCNVSRSEMPRKSCHGHGSTEKTAVSNIVLHGFPLLAIHFFLFSERTRICCSRPQDTNLPRGRRKHLAPHVDSARRS